MSLLHSKNDGTLTDLLRTVLTALLAGAIGGLIGGTAGFDGVLIKPPLTPPGWVFPVVWTVLYILMGTAAWMVGKSGDDKAAPALRLYRIQLIVNVLWPLLFFRLSLRLPALLWLLLLIALIVGTIRRFYAIRPTAALLLLPYLAWCLFAAYLNLGFYLLNS